MGGGRNVARPSRNCGNVLKGDTSTCIYGIFAGCPVTKLRVDLQPRTVALRYRTLEAPPKPLKTAFLKALTPSS
ncbi:hypothetical protein V1478_002680 [Vespula squamosa]|uniref:Uncharacterized protein n=1 Tax=Vespula squamosa TaxID=30214 RepID=A0ABD2BT99_VESSQ